MIELLGLLLPPLIDLINRKFTDSDIKFWISVIICALVGTILNFTSNNFHFVSQDSLAKSILTVFGVAQLSYKGMWESSKLRSTLNLGTGS